MTKNYSLKEGNLPEQATDQVSNYRNNYEPINPSGGFSASLLSTNFDFEPYEFELLKLRGYDDHRACYFRVNTTKSMPQKCKEASRRWI